MRRCGAYWPTDGLTLALRGFEIDGRHLLASHGVVLETFSCRMLSSLGYLAPALCAIPFSELVARPCRHRGRTLLYRTARPRVAFSQWRASSTFRHTAGIWYLLNRCHLRHHDDDDDDAIVDTMEIGTRASRPQAKSILEYSAFYLAGVNDNKASSAIIRTDVTDREQGAAAFYI